ncbi:hypothetical protein NFI96_010313, partial [Prochilodus magdalenae]
ISLIEPGPVITDFEHKVYEEGMKTDLSKADDVTADMFLNIYMKHWTQIFESLGQTPEVIAEHTLKIILMDNPPFRHQTNTLYTPVTTLKYADPNGDLPIDTFYKVVFEHDKVFSASLNFLKLLRWRSRKSFNLKQPLFSTTRATRFRLSGGLFLGKPRRLASASTRALAVQWELLLVEPAGSLNCLIQPRSLSD